VREEGRGQEERTGGKGNHLVENVPFPTGMIKGKSVGAAGAQRWLSLQIGTGTTHLDR
jgi:hypothetical protein